MSPELGKYLIFIGILLLVTGVIIYFFWDKLSFLGKLPGDFRFEITNGKFYFPLTTSLIISLVLGLIVKLFQFFSR